MSYYLADQYSQKVNVAVRRCFIGRVRPKAPALFGSCADQSARLDHLIYALASGDVDRAPNDRWRNRVTANDNRRATLAP